MSAPLMKYCGNQECERWAWYCSDSKFCEVCGGELTPCVPCGCGQEQINPKEILMYRNEGVAFRHCKFCGARHDEAYLGRRMAEVLRGMVQEISRGMSQVGVGVN